MKHRLFVIGLVCGLGNHLSAQTKVETVTGPTRLDWRFAIERFGDDAGTLLKDFDSSKQKYQLHVPKNYQADRAWPLLLFISPGNQPAGFGAWQKVCEKESVFFCSPYQAGNNVPPGKRTRIVLDVLDDVRRKYKIDPEQTYLSGFSGGGRMACAIGFALPEYFGGIVPICGINTLGSQAYLRHRAQDRLSLAFVTGEKDFNRKENEAFMHPLMKDLGIRSRLWVVPKTGHAIPGADVMAEVYAWLKDDLPRRRADVKDRPELTVAADQAPTADVQAASFVKAARANLEDKEAVWRGVTLLQGVKARWSETAAGKEAAALLQKLAVDESLLDAVAAQGAADEQKTLRAQALAFERFGLVPQALRAWQLLAQNHPNTEAGALARKNIERLQKK